MKQVLCLWLFLECVFGIYLISASSQPQVLQAKITSQLMEIKKAHPEVQRVVYTVMDLTTKLAQTAKTALTECEDLRKTCKQKNDEIETLKVASRESFKKELAKTRESLETVKTELAKQLEDEKKRTALLEQEKNELKKRMQESGKNTMAKKEDGDIDLDESALNVDV